MTLRTRRRVLGLLSGTGVAGVAGCFGSDEDPNDDGRGENRDDAGDNGAADGNGDESNDDEPDELDIPEPVDWTDESRATIEIGPGGEIRFEPDAVRVETGTTLRWVWMSNGHTLVPTHQPDGGGFEGNETVEDGGFEVEFVPETPGEYRYVCEEHEGMVGYLVVE